MIRFKKSLVSAYHNYLVNHMLSPAFVLGDTNSDDEFFFLADVVPPGEITPRIYARLFDGSGLFLLDLDKNTIGENPGRCSFQSTPGGFRIAYPTGELVLDIGTQKFTNGYLTRIQGKLYDKKGTLRMEPSYEGIQVYGDGCLAFDRPLKPSSV